MPNGCTVSGAIDVGIGRATAYAIKKEENWGCVSTTGTVGWHFLPQTGNDVNGVIEQLEDPTIIGSRATQPSLAGTDEITGGIDLSVDPEKVGFSLYYALGATVATSGSQGDWTHSFWPTDLDDIRNDLPSFSSIRKLDKFDVRMRGGRVNTLSFDQGLGEVLLSTMDVQQRDEERPPDAEVPQTPQISTDPFKFRDGQIQTDIGGALDSVAEIQDISFEINNNLDGDVTIESGQFIGYLVGMTRNITGSMTITYQDDTFYNAYVNDQRFELKLRYESEQATAGTSNNPKYVEYRFPRVKLTAAPVSIGGGDEVLTQDSDFEAFFSVDATQTLADSTTLEGFDIYVELYNSTESGTYQN